MALVGLAVSAAQSVAGYAGQVQQANAQNKAYVANAANANRAATAQYADTQMRMGQEQEAAAQQKQETARDARAARATALVTAGEAGVSGLSVAGLLQEFYGREGQFNANTDRNLQWTEQQLTNQMKGQQAQATDRINSVQRAQRPSFLDAGLRILGAGVDSYAEYKKTQQQAPVL
jgi:hypothetical protein